MSFRWSTILALVLVTMAYSGDRGSFEIARPFQRVDLSPSGDVSANGTVLARVAGDGIVLKENPTDTLASQRRLRRLLANASVKFSKTGQLAGVINSEGRKIRSPQGRALPADWLDQLNGKKPIVSPGKAPGSGLQGSFDLKVGK